MVDLRQLQHSRIRGTVVLDRKIAIAQPRAIDRPYRIGEPIQRVRFMHAGPLEKLGAIERFIGLQPFGHVRHPVAAQKPFRHQPIRQ